MKIIGVELHTPSFNELSVLAVLSLIYSAAAFLLVNLGIMTVTEVAPFLIAAVSGSLTASLGCSIMKYGVRGAILTAGFCVAMMGLYWVLAYLIELF